MSAQFNEPVLIAKNISRNYTQGETTTQALKPTQLEICKGEFVTIMGPSGSGKSTLLHLLGGLDTPSTGTIQLGGHQIATLSDKQLSRFRRKNLGFIFQFFNLLPTLSALENICLPQLLDGKTLADVSKRAKDLLEMLQLSHRVHHRPDQLSGGEMQRVAIARALISNPVLILADEPTGNLDSKTGKTVLEFLQKISQEQKQTIIMVTHDLNAASYGNRQIKMRDGSIEHDSGLSRAILNQNSLHTQNI